MKRFEYKIVETMVTLAEKRLNHHGSNGWKLSSVVSLPNGIDMKFIFSREILDSELSKFAEDAKRKYFEENM